MIICTGATPWGYFFLFCEILATCALCFVYFKAVWRLIVHNEKDFYEKLDLLVVFLSSAQIALMMIMLCVNEYFIVSLLISILKFSENAVVCCLLLVIIMWKHYTVTYVVVNYFMMFILVFDIVTFLFGIFDYKPFNTDYCKPKLIIVLVLLGFILDVVAIGGGLYLRAKDNEETSEGITEGDQLYINDMFNKYVDSMKRMMKAYLIITVLFMASFAIELLFQIILKQNSDITASPPNEAIPRAKTCDYFGHFDSKFSVKHYLICFASFFIRDLSPLLGIYCSILIYKPSNLSRSSSFIEIL